MTWFEQLTGFREESPSQVRENLSVEEGVLHSYVNGKSWSCGELEIPTLAELRERVREHAFPSGKLVLREVVADVQSLHQQEANAGAMFQVASQFNLLEMVSPSMTPEQGVGIYGRDRTQGPACAISAGAGTIFRNYFADVNGRVGQTHDNQIDCLAEIGSLLGNHHQRLWEMRNGYAIASLQGLKEISQRLKDSDGLERDFLRRSLRIGIQWNTEVTLKGASHSLSQVYCSALPVAYSRHSSALWSDFAQLILEAAYEATFAAAIINYARTGSSRLFLTLLGGGAFGNETEWILAAIRRAVEIYATADLDVAIVSYGSSRPYVQELIRDLI
jgi:hypothetical protein